MAVFPTLPPDNLYKFLALFGLVILVFGIAFPSEKLTRSFAQVDDAQRERGIAKIRISRKVAQMHDAMDQFNKKAAEIDKEQKLLQDAGAMLEAKRQSKTLESAEAEVHALTEQTRQHKENVRKYSEEIEKAKAQSAQFSDELAIEELNMKAFSESIHALDGQIALWGWVTCSSIIIGVLMMSLGFRQWYTKVQVYEDAILRKQAGEIKEQTDTHHES